jgi:hypothetical protein
VFGIVAQSGRSITVASEPGAGTTFRVYLPRVDVEPDEDRSEASDPEAAVASCRSWRGPSWPAELRRLHPTIKVLFISGYAPDATGHRAVPEMHAVLDKPFGVRTPARKVREVLDQADD